MVSNQHNKDIFEQLRQGQAVAANNPEAYRLREASFATKKLLVQMNNSSVPAEIRNLLTQITDSKIDESVVVFTPPILVCPSNAGLYFEFASLVSTDSSRLSVALLLPIALFDAPGSSLQDTDKIEMARLAASKYKLVFIQNFMV